jgi:hypothetical protein
MLNPKQKHFKDPIKYNYNYYQSYYNYYCPPYYYYYPHSYYYPNHQQTQTSPSRDSRSNTNTSQENNIIFVQQHKQSTVSKVRPKKNEESIYATREMVMAQSWPTESG